jgi:Kef-type K+ transport system membrane component KefB
MIAMHDLFMVPLLALPELLSSVVDFKGSDKADDDDDTVKTDKSEEWNFYNATVRIVLVVVFFKACMILGKHVVAAANYAQSRIMGEKGELFTLSIVAYALLVSSLSDQLELSIEAGAVLAGIALMRSPHVPKVLASIQSITSVFGGMFMTSLGMIISPTFVVEEASSIIQLVFLIALFKLALVSTILNRFFDYGITASLAVGSAMAQISETSLVVLAKSQRIGLVSRKTYLLLIPTTCMMLTLAPFSAAHL